MASQPELDAWFAGRVALPNPRLRLFCFPFAGGAGMAFAAWRRAFGSEVEVCPITLPGRFARFREPAYVEFPPLVDALTNAIEPLLDRPFAFFGYSMGALLALEVAGRIRERCGKEPSQFFAAACLPPQTPRRDLRLLLELDDEAFLDQVKNRYDILPSTFADDPSLRAWIVQAMRADLGLCASYEPSVRRPLSCPLYAWGGDSDPSTSPELLADWKPYTSGSFSIRVFPGSHFFLKSAGEEVVAAVRTELESVGRSHAVAGSRLTEHSLRGKTVFVTGASRGIGKAIALGAARAGANVVIAAKTVAPNPLLPGTIYTTAQEVEREGGRALPVAMDLRQTEQIERAVARAVETFGGIDVLVNNAGAMYLTDTPRTSAQHLDTMLQLNVRGTFLCTQQCLPYLSRAGNPHVLLIAPPITLDARWLSPHAAYTVSKYAMSMLAQAWMAELPPKGIAVNCLWPKTTIDTIVVRNLLGDAVAATSRRPEIMSDAAQLIVTQPARACSGHFYLDEDLLREHGAELDHYAVTPGSALSPDLFV